MLRIFFPPIINSGVNGALAIRFECPTFQLEESLSWSIKSNKGPAECLRGYLLLRFISCFYLQKKKKQQTKRYTWIMYVTIQLLYFFNDKSDKWAQKYFLTFIKRFYMFINKGVSSYSVQLNPVTVVRAQVIVTRTCNRKLSLVERNYWRSHHQFLNTLKVSAKLHWDWLPSINLSPRD